MIFVESKKKIAEGKVNFFTSASNAYDVDGTEFIAVATSSGEIYAVTINGTNY